MSRQPIETRPSTAQWLIAAREAAGFTNAPDFLEAVKAAEGKAPSYSTYAQWEAGSVTPRSSTLAPIRRFHEASQPEGAKLPKPTPDLATALASLAAATEKMATELTAIREERKLLASRVEDLAAQVAELVQAGRAARGNAAPEATGALGQ